MLNLLYLAAAWLVREVVIKAMIIAALFWAMTYLMPMVISYVSPWIGVSSLNSFFAAVPDGLYWMFYALRFDFGIPLIVSASITKFLIRRIPLIG